MKAEVYSGERCSARFPALIQCPKIKEKNVGIRKEKGKTIAIEQVQRRRSSLVQDNHLATSRRSIAFEKDIL